jgi:tyrosyl-tRNA synthetase
MLHGETALEKAERASRILFGEAISELKAEDILDIFADVPSTQLSKSQFEGNGTSIIELMMACGLATSKSDGRRLIQGGGVYLNNRRVNNEQQMASLSDSIEGQFLVLRKGQKQYHLIRLGEVQHGRSGL